MHRSGVAAECGLAHLGVVSAHVLWKHKSRLVRYGRLAPYIKAGGKALMSH
jgi:hypothetical protein